MILGVGNFRLFLSCTQAYFDSSLMKILISFIFVIPLFLFGQKNIPVGQGILKIETTKLPLIQFYKDTLQKTPVKTVSVVLKDGELSIKNKTETLKWFKPEQLYLDYNILILRVDTVIGDWTKVYVNNEKQTKLWTKIGGFNKYLTWTNFFKTQVSNITKGTKEVLVKVASTDNSKTIKKMEKEDCLEIVEIKGNWIKIKTHSVLECSTTKYPVKIGWLQWQKNNVLQIEFGLTD
jgi:hypothetical protein